MERNQANRFNDTPNTLANVRMNALERARAEEGMAQAMLLAELTLAGVARVRHALDSAGHAMYLAFGRRGL
jgi:hypothetical protein